MKLVAITRILNEADIVEAFVRHTGALVDHHILLDNGSTDATLDILKSLYIEGLSLEVHHSAKVAFAEAEQNNYLFLLAAGLRGADWVMPLDTDEFVDTPDDGTALRTALSVDSPDAFKVRVREFVASPDDDSGELLVTARIIRARAPTDNLKVIARGSLLQRGARLWAGGHSVRFGEEEVPWQRLDGTVYAHYAARSAWQWLSKFVIGWSKVLAAGPGEVTAGSSAHYREPFRVLRANPEAMLRNPTFLEMRRNHDDLVVDPLHYRGTPLQYTRPVDHQMRAVRALMTHLEKLSLHHGELLSDAGRKIDMAGPGGPP
jgi:glycosyltransferase involved in cell wall biosynthesis